MPNNHCRYCKQDQSQEHHAPDCPLFYYHREEVTLMRLLLNGADMRVCPMCSKKLTQRLSACEVCLECCDTILLEDGERVCRAGGYLMPSDDAIVLDGAMTERPMVRAC